MNLFKINNNNKTVNLKRESSLSTSMMGKKDEPDYVLERLKKLRKLNEANQRRSAIMLSNNLNSPTITIESIDDNMEGLTVSGTVVANVITQN